MLPLKALLLSTGVISMAVMLKLSLPVILDFLTSELPLFWSLALSWLRPPYLYLLINCIIISIAASSMLQPRSGGDHDGDRYFLTPAPEKFTTPVKVPAVERDDLPAVLDDVVVFGYIESPVVVKENLTLNQNQNQNHVVSPLKKGIFAEDEVKEEREVFGDENDFVLSKSMWNSSGKTTAAMAELSPAEKPPFSSRFGNRRAVKASPEGKAALKVSRPKKHETLESTWRTMTEGRSMPLTRHLRKSDTFAGASPENSPVRVIKKSDTFSGENSSPMSGGSGRLRKEPSLSQDELNRRVEAFIKKFNEEMRLQRQESLNQYKEMINRGSH